MQNVPPTQADIIVRLKLSTWLENKTTHSFTAFIYLLAEDLLSTDWLTFLPLSLALNSSANVT